MPPKQNPLRLNGLQLRTLALAQQLAKDARLARANEASGEVTLMHVPHPHGDHMHIGPVVVSTRFASGLTNPSVWTALARKGLARGGDGSGAVVLTAEGLAYDTGLADRFVAPSDH